MSLSSSLSNSSTSPRSSGTSSLLNPRSSELSVWDGLRAGSSSVSSGHLFISSKLHVSGSKFQATAAPRCDLGFGIWHLIERWREDGKAKDTNRSRKQ